MLVRPLVQVLVLVPSVQPSGQLVVQPHQLLQLLQPPPPTPLDVQRGHRVPPAVLDTRPSTGRREGGGAQQRGDVHLQVCAPCELARDQVLAILLVL